jgi:hypothetical protein
MSEHPLIGTWRLVSFDVRDEGGRITHPFGRDAVGFITYTADGHMAVQFGRADRARLAVGDWVGAAPSEIATAARASLRTAAPTCLATARSGTGWS